MHDRTDPHPERIGMLQFDHTRRGRPMWVRRVGSLFSCFVYGVRAGMASAPGWANIVQRPPRPAVSTPVWRRGAHVDVEVTDAKGLTFGPFRGL